MNPSAQMLPGGRLHLQHGPSDLIVFAEGDRDRAYRAATDRFQTIIAELVEELSILRAPLGANSKVPLGPVARRMHRAAQPFVCFGFVTGMAAVAGAISDEILAAMTDAGDLSRAYVNNGGDIALHLSPGTKFTSAMRDHQGRDLGRIQIKAEDPVRGIATSGHHGRSVSLGIADSVTVLATDAAQADVAATMIANAVDLPGHPAVTRRPARDVVDDSDLGDRPVVVHCGPLATHDRDRALVTGRARADQMQRQGLITGAGLFLQDQATTTDGCLIHPKTLALSA